MIQISSIWELWKWQCINQTVCKNACWQRDLLPTSKSNGKHNKHNAYYVKSSGSHTTYIGFTPCECVQAYIIYTIILRANNINITSTSFWRQSSTTLYLTKINTNDSMTDAMFITELSCRELATHAYWLLRWGSAFSRAIFHCVWSIDCTNANYIRQQYKGGQCLPRNPTLKMRHVPQTEHIRPGSPSTILSHHACWWRGRPGSALAKQPASQLLRSQFVNCVSNFCAAADTSHYDQRNIKPDSLLN